MTLSIRAATDTDLSILAQMNKRLVEDEHSRNPMSVNELQNRMTRWLNGDWIIKLFIEANAVVG